MHRGGGTLPRGSTGPCEDEQIIGRQSCDSDVRMSPRENVEPTTQTEQPDDTVERLRTIASEVGFDITALAPLVIERMRLLDAHTETATDGTRMADYARRV